MKYFTLLFILLFTFTVSNAQVFVFPKEPGNEKIQVVKPKTLKENFPQAKLLHSNGKGKVYALPQDNMPCLVPHINSNMPVAGLGINKTQKIPNALPEQKIIPEKVPMDVPGQRK